jgi:hypothetical protein
MKPSNYVLSTPIWSDAEYDRFCEWNKLDGKGGSDSAGDYCDTIQKLARDMIAEPQSWPPPKD